MEEPKTDPFHFLLLHLPSCYSFKATIHLIGSENSFSSMRTRSLSAVKKKSLALPILFAIIIAFLINILAICWKQFPICLHIWRLTKEHWLVDSILGGGTTENSVCFICLVYLFYVTFFQSVFVPCPCKAYLENVFHHGRNKNGPDLFASFLCIITLL